MKFGGEISGVAAFVMCTLVYFSVIHAIGQGLYLYVFCKNGVIIWIFYIQDIRFCTSGLRSSEKQSDCVTLYLSVIGHVGCFDTP